MDTAVQVNNSIQVSSITSEVPTEITDRNTTDRELFPCFGTDIIKESLIAFYNKDNNAHKVIPILSGKTRVSLRLLDWFVTNYSKKHRTVYRVLGDYFIVHMEYKSQLKAFSKNRFDPFCRHANAKNTDKKDLISIRYRVPDTRKKKSTGTIENVIHTTVGQLNFFKWALQNGIIDYVIQHFADINKDMDEYNDSRKSLNGSCVYMTASKTVTKYNVSVTVSFT